MTNRSTNHHERIISLPIETASRLEELLRTSAQARKLDAGKRRQFKMYSKILKKNIKDTSSLQTQVSGKVLLCILKLLANTVIITNVVRKVVDGVVS